MIVLACGLLRTGSASRSAAWSLGGGASALSLVGIVPGSAYAITASLVFAVGMLSVARRRQPAGSNAPSLQATSRLAVAR